MNKSKYPAELKLKALGLIAADENLKEIVTQLNIPYGTLLNWKRELKDGIDNGNLANLVDIDEVLVSEVAEQLAENLIALDPTQAAAIEGELLQLTNGVDGYQALSIELQQVASRLARKINTIALTTTGTAELESLVTSLARLQDSFFNKNVTQVAVFGGGETSSTSVEKFKSFQKA